MAWNPNIPQPGDLISQSQDQILQNFQALDPLFQGIDQFVLLPVQGAAPATTITQMAIYTKTSALTARPEVYIRRQSSGAQIEATGTGAGWSYLPSGVLIKWGSATTTTYNTLETFTFPVGAAIPAFNTLLSVQLTPASANGDPNQVMILGNLTATTFQVYARQLLGIGGATPFTYFAIGT